MLGKRIAKYIREHKKLVKIWAEIREFFKKAGYKIRSCPPLGPITLSLSPTDRERFRTLNIQQAEYLMVLIQTQQQLPNFCADARERNLKESVYQDGTYGRRIYSASSQIFRR